MASQDNCSRAAACPAAPIGTAWRWRAILARFDQPQKNGSSWRTPSVPGPTGNARSGTKKSPNSLPPPVPQNG